MKGSVGGKAGFDQAAQIFMKLRAIALALGRQGKGDLRLPERLGIGDSFLPAFGPIIKSSFRLGDSVFAVGLARCPLHLARDLAAAPCGELPEPLGVAASLLRLIGEIDSEKERDAGLLQRL